ncbi:acyl-CoA N-acyltransferase [Lophium mytilinum]|uniref:Acyl-CoA N-acyltransferase n=1 Tax=Lophium mytilinum TaxID=390894 RepID=A0A6A6R5Y4_9PEZI|nr:acyl-CoA N-acyltransferase [Lophium mytilinum]
MPIRPARYADLPAIAALCSIALEDELWGDLMHPLRAKFPADYAKFWLRRTRENWWDYTRVFYVATTTELTDGRKQEVVAGVAEWELQGSVQPAMAWWDPRRAMKPAMALLNNLSLLISPNRAANPDPKFASPLYDSFPFFQHHWQGERANTYFLDVLGVHPKYQGHGFGRELLQWGLEQAQKQDVCVSLISSASGRGFYKRMGFGKEVGMCTEGEGNPLADLGSGWILFKDPVRAEGVDVLGGHRYL